MSNASHDVTSLLVELSAGNEQIVDSLTPIVYDELHEIARRQLRGERSGHTLNATALVHEAYLKLINQERVTWQSRAHFLSVAAIAMRRILINYAHRRRAQKRGGGNAVATFEESFGYGSEVRSDELIALDEALEKLARISDRQAKVVECRFFGGLTQEEIAEVLNVSVQTVRRDWRIARAWLAREMRGSNPE